MPDPKFAVGGKVLVFRTRTTGSGLARLGEGAPGKVVSVQSGSGVAVFSATWENPSEGGWAHSVIFDLETGWEQGASDRPKCLVVAMDQDRRRAGALAILEYVGVRAAIWTPTPLLVALAEAVTRSQPNYDIAFRAAAEGKIGGQAK